MNEFCIVSSLFNINREEMDGRKWEEYLSWFGETLKLDVPMVLFVQQDLEEFILERRSQENTKIVVQKLEEIPLYYLKDEMDAIISNDEYQTTTLKNFRIECQHSIYSIIQYSKFSWLKYVSEKKYFNSKFYFWLDAGASRFFNGFNFEKKYPGENALKALDLMGDSFLIQFNNDGIYPDLINAESLPLSYLKDPRSFVCGSHFGGNKKSIEIIKKEVMDIFVNEMLKNNFINNEQIVLGYLLKNKPDLFMEFEKRGNNHMEIFEELTK